MRNMTILNNSFDIACAESGRFFYAYYYYYTFSQHNRRIRP